MKYCVNCKEINSVEANFCSKCGNSMLSYYQALCENGHENSRLDKFCSKCGAPILLVKRELV